MIDNHKVKSSHTCRAAVVYIRRSHPSQVENNRESTARQYALVEKAIAKGNDSVLTYNSKKADAEDAVKQIEQTGRKAATLPLDVSDSKSFDGFFEKLKEVLQANWKRDDFDFLVIMPASAFILPLRKPAKSNLMN
jgi:NAD(P)-dependent dehydrogenase (short-subunit alcohol dehydrogenase family)